MKQNMEQFTFGIYFQINGEKYYLIRELSIYINNRNNLFDGKKFLRENYCIFETDNKISDKFDNQIIKGENLDVLGYLNYDDSIDINNLIKLLNNDFDSQLQSKIFFIEGGIYSIYDEEGTKIKSIKIDRRAGQFGINYLELFDKKIEINIYNSKIVNHEDLICILNKVNDLFPEGIDKIKKLSNYFGVKIEEELNMINKIFNDILSNLINTDIEYVIENKEFEIYKKDYKSNVYSYDNKLQDLIVGEGGWDNIDGDSIIKVRKKIINYNIEENQIIYGILTQLKEYNLPDIIDYEDYLNIFEEKKVDKKILKSLNDTSQKINQNPLLNEFIENYFKLLDDEKKDKKNFINEQSDILNPIQKINDIFEIYSFIVFNEFLSKELSFDFSDKLREKLYLENDIIRYEDNNNLGYLDGFYNNNKFRYYFGDKITPNDNRSYEFFTEDNNLAFLNNKLKKISQNGLTPDISLEFDDKFFIMDVKFSAFKDDGIEFPNPEYFQNELNKYRKIIKNGKIIDTPIIIFYPGEIDEENLQKFKLMFEFVKTSYNMLLFPVHKQSQDNTKLNIFLKEEFIKVFN